MRAVTFRQPYAPRGQPAERRTGTPTEPGLDDLATLSAREALALYRSGRAPRLTDLRGARHGRFIALEGTKHGWLARALRALFGSRLFPWRGKSFAPLAESHGEGVNLLLSDSKPRRWLRFETYVARSRAGDFDALHLDYDTPENPFFVRALKDELREVAPGLYLGQAYFVTRRRARLVLYFALQTEA